MDFLSNILGIGRKIKEKVPKLWNQGAEEVQQHVIQPLRSFGRQANNAVQRTAGGIGNAGIDYLFRKPTRMAEKIGQGGLDRITGKKDILPYADYSPKFMDAPKTNVTKGIYNMGAGFVNAVGTEGIIKPVNDLAQGVADLAYKNPINRDNFKSGAFRLGADLTGGQTNVQGALSDAAKTIMPILNAWTGGKAQTVIEGKALAKVMSGEFGKELQKQALRKIATESSKTMGKLTGAFTGLQSLIDGEDKPITKDIVDAGLAALGGYAGGRVLGFATPYAGKEVSSLIRDTKARFNPKVTKTLVAEINGQKMSLPQVEEHLTKVNQENYLGQYNQAEIKDWAQTLFAKAKQEVQSVEAPFVPESMTGKLIQKTEGAPAGLSIKDVNGSELQKNMLKAAYESGNMKKFKELGGTMQDMLEITGTPRKSPIAPRDQVGAKSAIDTFIAEKGNRPYIAGIPPRWMYKENGVPTDVPAELSALLDKTKFQFNPSTKVTKTSNNLYHTTSAENLDSIANEGLVVGKAPRFEGVSSSKKISFSANEDAAKYYGGNNDVMIRTKTSYKPGDLEPDLLAGGEGVYTTGQNIPADQLEVKINGKWQPLKTSKPINAPLTPEAPVGGAKSAAQIIQEAQNGAGGGKIPPKPPVNANAPAGELPGQNKKLADLGINTDHLNVSDEAKATIDQAMGEIKPKLENTVGKVMSKDEVMKAAESTAQTLKKSLTRDEVLDIGQRALNLRQEIATEAEKGTVTPKLMELLKLDKEFSSGQARLLQQRSIDVSPGEKSAMLTMIDEMSKKVDDIDGMLQAAQGVDFNDANQAAIFYRQFVKPNIGDWIDKLRYNSTLTSPLSHIVNIGSNLVNSGVITPIKKTVAGGLDFLGSSVTGNSREQFAGEGVQFAKGYATSLGDAATRFAEVMKGTKAQTNLDTRSIPLHPEGGLAGKAEAALSFPLKLLEGMDQFFTALTEGGERAGLTYREGKGVKVPNMDKKIQDAAAYPIFRQDLHADGQGTLLNAVDTVTGMVMKARNSEDPIIRNIAKWTFLFVKTPMNIFKQGIEFSPAGFATLHGAENKVDQLAKAAIGSTIFAGAAMFSGSGRLTWAEPINEKEKNAFRAAGLQPYSIKLGNTWYSYQKLPPALSFSLAMVAAIDDTQKNAKLDDGTFEQIVTAVAKYGTFLSDQSYAKSMGDLLSAAKGGENGIARLFSNYPQQLVPYRALGGWLARLTDDTQRKLDPNGSFIEKQVQSLMQNIPGLSDNTMARTDEFGNEIKNNNNIINSFSPVRTSEENQQGADRFNEMSAEKRATSMKKQAKEQLKNGGSLGEMTGKSEQLKSLGEAGNYIFAYDLEKYIGDNKETGIKKFTHDADKATVARNIMEGTSTYENIPEDQKSAIYEAMGLKQEDVEYDYLASQSSSAVSSYLQEQISANGADHNQTVQALITGRKSSISGKMLASNAVIDDFYNAGLITKAEQAALKKVKYDRNGKNISTPAKGSGGKAKRTAIATALKKGPTLEKVAQPASAKEVQGVKVPQQKADVTLSKARIPSNQPISMAQLFQKSNPMAGTSVAKAKALVSSLGGSAPKGSNTKLSQSFYKG